LNNKNIPPASHKLSYSLFPKEFFGQNGNLTHRFVNSYR